MNHELALTTLEAVLDEKQERGEATALERTALDFFVVGTAPILCRREEVEDEKPFMSGVPSLQAGQTIDLLLSMEDMKRIIESYEAAADGDVG